MSTKLQAIGDYRKTRFIKPPDLRTIKKWCENKQIPSKQIGGKWFVEVDENFEESANPFSLVAKNVALTGNKKVDDLVRHALGR